MSAKGYHVFVVSKDHNNKKYILQGVYFDLTKAYNCVIQLTPKISIPLLFYVQNLKFRHMSEG